MGRGSASVAMSFIRRFVSSRKLGSPVSPYGAHDSAVHSGLRSCDW